MGMGMHMHHRIRVPANVVFRFSPGNKSAGVFLSPSYSGTALEITSVFSRSTVREGPRGLCNYCLSTECARNGFAALYPAYCRNKPGLLR